VPSDPSAEPTDRTPPSPARSPSSAGPKTGAQGPAKSGKDDLPDADSAEPVPHEHLPIRSDDN
jgi:hypothetical protein